MFTFGRKIFYDKTTGLVLYDTGDTAVSFANWEAPDWYEVVQVLKDRVPETVGELQLEYGQYTDDYNAGGYIERVDLETGDPLFAYPPEPGVIDPPTPQPPLSDQVKAVGQRLADLELVMTEIMLG